MLVDADLPDDPTLLRAMLVAARGEIAQQQARILDLEGAGTDARAEIERLNAIIAAFQRHRFGARSEQFHPDQLALALEELEAALSRVRAGVGSAAKPVALRVRDGNRGHLPAHFEPSSRSSMWRARPAPAAAACFTSSVRTCPSGSTWFRPRSACW